MLLFEDSSFLLEEGPENPPSVFLLASPADLLHKLAWEIRQLSKAGAHDTNGPAFDRSPAFCAFNCALTAWHIVDWVWESADTERRSGLANAFRFSLCADNRKNLERFSDALTRSSVALRICREIANGSKHMKLKRADPNIKANASFLPVVEPIGRFKSGGYALSLGVTQGNKEISASKLFIDAFAFWENFLAEWGFVEGTKYVEGRPLGPKDIETPIA